MSSPSDEERRLLLEAFYEGAGDAILARADRALYTAKRSGRNRVSVLAAQSRVQPEAR